VTGPAAPRSEGSPLLEVQHLHQRFAQGANSVVAIEDISFEVAPAEFVAIVGPSGSGKTTLLRCLSGLMRPTSGLIKLNGQPVTEVPAELAVVFQDYSRSLFPWLTVRANVEMPLRRLGLDRAERDDRIATSLEEVGLGDVGGLYPWQLSGGMQQRVAIARAFAFKPALLLMDEPFASVDAQTRADLQDMLLEVWKRHDSTVLFVTHDIDESVFLADRIVVLSRPPARVTADIAVDLDRPRDQIATKETRRFAEIRGEVARLIKRPAAAEAAAGAGGKPAPGSGGGVPEVTGSEGSAR
jgi:NitT/TauT family transport system ATP-binding protein